MEIPVDILAKIDIGNLLAMALMLWIFYNRLDKKIDLRLDKVDQRFDKLDEKVTDMDRRLCRLEGAFASKDCCMIKDDSQLKKVS